MSNMSYCRFRNTFLDLYDCNEALEELFHREGDSLLEDEFDQAEQLIELCKEIAENYSVEELKEAQEEAKRMEKYRERQHLEKE